MLILEGVNNVLCEGVDLFFDENEVLWLRGSEIIDWNRGVKTMSPVIIVVCSGLFATPQLCMTLLSLGSLWL